MHYGWVVICNKQVFTASWGNLLSKFRCIANYCPRMSSFAIHVITLFVCFGDKFFHLKYIKSLYKTSIFISEYATYALSKFKIVAYLLEYDWIEFLIVIKSLPTIFYFSIKLLLS